MKAEEENTMSTMTIERYERVISQFDFAGHIYEKRQKGGKGGNDAAGIVD